jgi:betaine reductase
MDPGTQSQILELANRSGQPPLVVTGAPDPESAELTAMTVVSGDPTYSGPLAGVQLGLRVYHVLEDEVRRATDPEVFEAQVGPMALVLDTEAIRLVLHRIRGSAGGMD